MKPSNTRTKKASAVAMDEDLGASTQRDIQNAVMRGYVAAHASGSPALMAELQKLLVTLLAAICCGRRVQRLSESRAEELADLLIKAVREANRMSESQDNSSD